QKHRSETEKLREFEMIHHQHQEAYKNLQYNSTQTDQSIKKALTHIQHGKKTLQQPESRTHRLEQELKALSGTDHDQLTELKTQITQTENQLHEVEQALIASEAAFTEASQKKEAAAAQVHEMQKTIENLRARYNALHNLQQKIENNEALKQWLQKHNLDAEERLWHHIQIEKEWENA